MINLLQAAQVHPVLPVTVNPTGASAKKNKQEKDSGAIEV